MQDEQGLRKHLVNCVLGSFRGVASEEEEVVRPAPFPNQPLGSLVLESLQEEVIWQLSQGGWGPLTFLLLRGLKSKTTKQKLMDLGSGVVVQVCNPSIQEDEAEG